MPPLFFNHNPLRALIMQQPKPGSINAKALFVILGLVSVLCQIILLRKLLATFHGNELTLGAVLAGWMVWTGGASFASGSITDKLTKPRLRLAACFTATALVLPLTLLFTPAVKSLFHFSRAELVGPQVMILGSLLLTGPVCVLLGLAFNLCCQAVSDKSHAVGRVYIWEALGSGMGGLLLSLALAGRVSIWSQTYLVMALLLGGSALAIGRKAYPWAAPAVIILSALTILDPAVGFPEWSKKLSWAEQHVLTIKDSRYGNLAALGNNEQVTIYVDAAPAFSWPDPHSAEPIAHLPLSMCDKPERVLVIRGGLATVAEQVLKHPVKKLDYLQLDPALTLIEAEHIRATGTLLDDPRVSVMHQDGYRFVRDAPDNSYDVIILNLGLPESANINRFYTREFMAQLRRVLAPGGVLSLTAGSSANYLSRAQAMLLAVMIKTAKTAFERVVVLPLDTHYLLCGGTGSRLTDQARDIDAVLSGRGIQTRFVRLDYLEADLHPLRLQAMHQSLDQLKPVIINSDLRPRGYLLGMGLWAEQSSPRLSRLIDSAGTWATWSMAIIPAALLLLGLPLVRGKSGQARGAVLAVGVMGFVSMSEQVAMMIVFQVIHGYIYHIIGLLVTAFMIGLAAGARTWEWLSLKGFAAAGQKYWLALLLILLCILGLAGLVMSSLLTRFQLPGVLTISLISLHLISTALVSGLIFAAGADTFKSRGAGVGRSAGWINGADHLGAAVGALLTATAVIPIFGIIPAFALAATLAGTAALLLVMAK